MSEEAESPFAILDTVGDAAGDSAEETPSEAKTEEAPSDEAKADEGKPESEGDVEEPAKPEAEPEKKDGEKAEPETEEPEPVEGEPPKLKEFMSKHKLSGDEKRWLKKQVFQNREFTELFPDVREAQAVRATFPEAEDWQGAAEARDQFVKASQDFEQNPKAFRDGLKGDNPQAYQRLVEAIAEDLPTAAPRARLEILSAGMDEIFNKLKAEAEEQGLDWSQITAKDLEDRIFPTEPEAQPRVDPRVAKLAEENRKLKEHQAREEKGNLAAVASVLDTRVEKVLTEESAKYVNQVIESKGADYTEAQKKLMTTELANAVIQRYRTTPSNVHAKRATLDALTRNQVKPEAAVAGLANRSRGEIRRLGADVFRHWTEVFVGANGKRLEKAEAQKSARAATRDVPPMATTPGGPKLDRTELLKKDKRAFWDAILPTP
jgi:hypothetical protein